MTYHLEDLFGVKGRAVIVTGGSSGLGAEIASALTDLGAQVAIIGRTKEKCDRVLAALREKNPSCLGFHLDITDEKAMEEAFAAVYKSFGRIDGLVNSAGICQIEDLENFEMKDFTRIIDVNLLGTVISCKLAGKYMLAAGCGSIVNISSQSTRVGKPGYTAYAASKAAVDGFTRALATEWIRKGVKVNSISPGLFVTDINRKEIEANPEIFRQRVADIPRGKAGEPPLLVAPVVALLTPGTDHMVGQTLAVDGGTSAGIMKVMALPKKTHRVPE
ncbi:MAG: SDR family oxidoreductase [Spirochaetales bacterium]|jgi:NAD(P)-dependent dehydrogenase (short-subunit alcohol dehydrogenase family)|nr:SDR family oxidoreductase [Spirochaetales bacterium]